MLQVRRGKLELKGYFTSKRDVAVNDNMINSYFNRHFVTALVYDRFFDQYIIRTTNGDKIVREITRFPYPLDEKTKLFQVGHATYLIVIQEEPTLEFFSIIGNSAIAMPNEGYIQNYKQLIRILFLQYLSVFAIFYRTTQNTIRAAIYKAVHNYSCRLAIDFEIDNVDCTRPYFDLMSNNYNDIVIFYVCSSKKGQFSAFKHKMDGPFMVIKEPKSKELLTINEQEKFPVFFNEFVEVVSPFKVVGEDFTLKDLESSIITIDLEKDEKIKIEGNFHHAKLTSKNPYISLIKRAESVKDVVFESETKYVRPYSNLKATNNEDNFHLLFGNYVYNNGRIEFNNDYFNCNVLVPTYIDDVDEAFYSSMFICRSKSNYEFYLTNLKTVSIKLDVSVVEPNSYITEIYVIKVRDFVFISFLYNTNTTFKVIKLISEGNFFKIVSSIVIKTDNFTIVSGLIGNSTYYFDYNEKTNSIVMFFHPSFSNQLNIITLNVEDNTIDTSNQEILEFYDGEKKHFYACKFFNKDDNKIGLFLTVQNMIYELELTYTDMWEYEILNKYYNNNGNPVFQTSIAFSDDYLAVLQKEEPSTSNILIYMRSEDDVADTVYCSIGKNILMSEDYRIATIEMTSKFNIDHLYVVYYEKKVEGTIQYERMKMKIIEIDSIKLKINQQKLRYKESIELEFIDTAYNMQRVTLTITLYENYKIFMFMIIFVVLLGLFIVLLIIIVYVYRENKRIREQFAEDLRDRDMISDSDASLGLNNR